MSSNLDPTDKAILSALQKDASQSLDSIAERLGVSLNTVWRRVRRLEEERILERRVALIDNEKIGLPLTAFVQIRTEKGLDHKLGSVLRYHLCIEFPAFKSKAAHEVIEMSNNLPS